MESPVEKVLKMIKDGTVNPEEGQHLLDALEEHFDMLPVDDEMAVLEDCEDAWEKEDVGTTEEIEEENTGDVSLAGVESVRINLSGELDLYLKGKESPEAVINVDREHVGCLKFRRENGILNISNHKACKTRCEKIDMEIRSPRAVPISIKARDGELNLRQIPGNIDIKGRSCDVFLQKFGGEKASISTNDSDIEVDIADGDLKIKSVSGDVRISEVIGSISVSTVSGDIELFKLSGDIDLQSRSGDIEGATLEGKINCKSASGDIEMTDLSGEAALSGNSGDIEIERSMGAFQLKTSSGDIEARKITVETLTARTSSGSIEADVEVLEEGSKLEAKTNSGYIVLRLPGECDGKITAKTRSGYIDNGAKLCKQDSAEEKFLEGYLSDSDMIDHPEISLKSNSGRIKIRR
ncbi:MAG: DUF4097 family beta strand repeat-containing protein [Candidatus Eremiobacteraeota bacterium]|nr:DUF4097 family beta strand repeat-containing protein [Candidatus Eremiobacteraeota bacterium]